MFGQVHRTIRSRTELLLESEITFGGRPIELVNKMCSWRVSAKLSRIDTIVKIGLRSGEQARYPEENTPFVLVLRSEWLAC